MISQKHVVIFEEGSIPNTHFPCLDLVEAKLFLLGLLKSIKRHVTFICSLVVCKFQNKTYLHHRPHWPGTAWEDRGTTRSKPGNFLQGREKERVGLCMPSFPIKLLINQLQSFPFPGETSWVGRGQEHLLMATGQY